MKPENELIHGIEEQTQTEIDKLTAQIAQIESDRSAAADREIEGVRREIDKRVELQRNRIDKAAEAVVATERHKIELETGNRFFARVTEVSAKRLRELVDSERYGEVLKAWIVEAAVGLAADDATVTVSSEERGLCEKILKEAEREASRRLGRRVHLQIGPNDPRGNQGPLLTAATGRTAFNNQVRTRMLRKETEIRRIIYEELSRSPRDSAPEPTLPRENEQRWVNE